MDIYVLDNELTRVRTVATSSECLSATEELELGKAGQLTLSLPISYKDTVKEMNILAIHDRDDRYRLYIVTNRNLNNYTLDIVAISYPNYALSRVGDVKDLRPKNRPLTELIPQILGNSGWTLNHVDENLPGYTGSFYYLSRLECLSQISEALACEFDFYVTIAKNVITGQFVDVLEMLGEDTNKRFEYGTNALEVVAEYDATEVYTQAVGRGKGEETGDGYGRRIEFTDVVWSKDNGDPVDKPAGQNWVNDPYENYQLPGNKRPQKIIEFEEITDPNVLLEETYKWLLDNNHPKVQFKAKIVETGSLNLGDRVQIIRPDLDIRYKTRVFKLTRNLLNENLTEVEFGDNIATTPMDKLNSITTQVNSTNQALQRVEEQVSLIDAEGNRITYGPDEPPVKKKGDMWYKTTPDGKTDLYIWNGEVWELTMNDALIADINKKIEDAMLEVDEAKEQANAARHEAANALEEAKNVGDSTLQFYNEFSDLKDGLNTKFLQTDELIAMQAKKIGMSLYPNGNFDDTNFNKYYTGARASITSDKNLFVSTNGSDKGYAFLSEYIEVDGTRPMDIKFSASMSNVNLRDKCFIYVHEYDDNKTETRNGSDLIFKKGEGPNSFYEIQKEWVFATKPKYIRVEWVIFPGVMGGMYIDNVSIYNGDNLTSQISMLSNDINLSVQKGDVINQINISTEGILIDGQKIHITGETSIDNAAIKDAAIANLSASKLTAGTIDANKIRVINMDVNSLTGNKAQFLQAAFKAANSTSYIDGYGIRTKKDGGNSTALNTGRLEMRDKGDNLVYSLGGADWLDPNGYDDTALMKILGRRQFTIGFATDDAEYTVSPMVSFKQRDDRNWMFIEDDKFRIVSRDGYRLRPGSSMNYENNKIYPSLTNDNESVGILLGDSDLIFRDGYADDAGSKQMTLNRIRSGQLDSLKTPEGKFTLTIRDGSINGNDAFVFSGQKAKPAVNWIAMNNSDIKLKANFNLYFGDRYGRDMTLDEIRRGKLDRLTTPSSTAYPIAIADSKINNNAALALSGTNKDNYIAINNADIYLKAKYNIIFDDGYGSGFTLNQLRSKLEKSASTLIAENGEIHLDSANLKGKQAKILADDEGACIAFADGTLMFRDLETDDWHTLSELLNNKGA